MTNLIETANTIVVESCSEICGDRFWYYKSQDLKKKDPENVGGLSLASNHECEDGNKNDGDGCSSQCKIEPKFSCRPEEGSEGPGKCVASTETSLKKLSGKNDPLSFELNFTRAVSLTKDKFDAKYNLQCQSKDLSKIISPNLDFRITEESGGEKFLLKISSEQFSEDVDGTIEVVLKQQASPGSRVLQTSTSDGKILDSEGMEVDLTGLKQDFKFNKGKFESQQSVDQISGTLDKVSGNTASQVLLIGLSMSPIMFSFTANVM